MLYALTESGGEDTSRWFAGESTAFCISEFMSTSAIHIRTVGSIVGHLGQREI
jgi:hypothetical protein